MNSDFAAAMRRALDHTRAQDVWKATNVIQATFAGTPAPTTDDGVPLDVEPPRPQQRPRLRLIDPDAEIVEPEAELRSISDRPGDGETPAGREPPRRTPRLRRPLADVVRALKEGRLALGVTQPFPGMGPTARKAPTPPPFTPEGAQYLTRSFTCSAGTRSYKLYIPANMSGIPHGLMVMLHGCTQDPDDFAVGTNMNAVAEAHGLLVAYPAQTASENVLSCWNWFRPGDQVRDAGEPAVIAGLTRAIISEFDLERDRVFVAGFSAGGAMTAVMGETYPDLYAAVGIHSGLAYASANDVMSALAAMRGQKGLEPRAKPRAPTATARTPRTIVFHGSADNTVHPSTADCIVAAVRAADPSGSSRSERRRLPDGRSYTRSMVDTAEGTRSLEFWLIDGTGHAWSGGHPSGTYTDPGGPDASSEMMRFFLNRS